MKNLTVYYLSISAMQKCIRRNDAVNAIRYGWMAWSQKPELLWKRLWTVLFEDCGRNINAMKAFYTHRTGYRSFEEIGELIRTMAVGPKSKDSNSLSRLIMRKKVSPIKMARVLRKSKKHCRVLELADEWSTKRMAMYDNYEMSKGLDWVIDVAERSLTFDREYLGVGAPYFWMKGYKYTKGEPVDEVGPLTYLNGWFPLEALDQHTRPGKYAYTVFLKHERLKYMTRDTFKQFVWFNEGYLLQSKDAYKYNFERLRFDCQTFDTESRTGACFFREDIGEYVRETILPELNKARKWVMLKSNRDDYVALKERYDKAKIEIG